MWLKAIGIYSERKRGRLIIRPLLPIRMVAGACNHPNLLVLPFSLELIRPAAQSARRLQFLAGFRIGDNPK